MVRKKWDKRRGCAEAEPRQEKSGVGCKSCRHWAKEGGPGEWDHSDGYQFSTRSKTRGRRASKIDFFLMLTGEAQLSPFSSGRSSVLGLIHEQKH